MPNQGRYIPSVMYVLICVGSFGWLEEEGGSISNTRMEAACFIAWPSYFSRLGCPAIFLFFACYSEKLSSLYADSKVSAFPETFRFLAPSFSQR